VLTTAAKRLRKSPSSRLQRERQYRYVNRDRAGAGLRVDSNAGLMAGVSLEGIKVTRLKI
jgi:hypothetical protein